MKRFSLIAVSFIFAAFLAVAAHGQAAPAATGKVGLINTYQFSDDKAGITKYRNAINSVENEFKTSSDELKTLTTKYTTLGQEIQKLRGQNNPQVPVSASTLEAKITEAQDLETSIKRKQEDLKARYERRYGQVVGPIYNDILKALQDFAKTKGYAVILDGAKLEEAQILLGFDEKYNITDEFVAFYNARPAGTATTAAPK